MTLQLLLLGDAPVAQLIERARLAEASGYSAVWVADERFYREVYSCLGQLSARTSRLLLGPCVTDPFARHPALTAMAIATLDEISGGRASSASARGSQGLPNSVSSEKSRRAQSAKRLI
jgi:5,10-methylenetetrahydromethanopterin reductase